MSTAPKWLRKQRQLREAYRRYPQRWIVGPSADDAELERLKARFIESTSHRQRPYYLVNDD